MRTLSKNLALILLLTAIFIVDDVLIYFLLKNVFSWQTSPVIIAIGGTVVFLLNLSLALLVYRIMRKKPTTGQQGMIGKVGVVLQEIRGEGTVQVQGEIWKAESSERLKVGTRVVVDELEGLSLIVSKAT